MTKFLMIKIILLQVIYSRYAPFVVTSSADGEQRPIYGGM
jgi:hypothetical protein